MNPLISGEAGITMQILPPPNPSAYAARVNNFRILPATIRALHKLQYVQYIGLKTMASLQKTQAIHRKS
jgi:hypothetical protein